MFDFTSLARPKSPNTCLYADASDTPSDADERAVRLDAAPREVIAAWDRIVRERPRVHVEASDPAGGTHHCVQRSALFRFADDVHAHAVAAAGGTRLRLYSASRTGHADLGVNAKRLKAWTDALRAEFPEG